MIPDKVGIKRGWLFNANDFTHALDNTSDFASRSISMPADFFPESSAIHRPSLEKGKVLMGLGKRRFASSLPRKKSRNGKDIPTIVGTTDLRGEIAAYCDFFRGNSGALAQAFLLNLLAADTPQSLGLADRPDVYLGALVGPGRKLAVLRPSEQTSTLSSADFAAWDAYLARGAEKIATVEIRHGLIKSDRWFKTWVSGNAIAYQSHWRYVARGTARFIRTHSKVVEAYAEAVALNEVLGEARRVILQQFPQTYAAAFDKAVEFVAKKDFRSSIGRDFRWSTGIPDGTPTHDRTAQHEAQVQEKAVDRQAELATHWKTFGVPPERHSAVQEKTLELLRTKAESAEPPHVLKGLSEHPPFRGLLETSRKNLRTVWTSAMAAQPEPAGRCAEAIRLIGDFEQRVASNHALFTPFRRTDTALSADAFRIARDRFRARVGSRCSFKSLFMDIWEVDGEFTNPITGIAVRLADNGANEKQASVDLGRVPSEGVRTIRWTGNAAELATLMAPGAGSKSRWTISNDCLPRLDRLPQINDALFDNGTIQISRKLRPLMSPSCEAYLIADRTLCAYNPALQRMTGLQQALLERPTLIAQGAAFVQDNLKNYGYTVVIPDEVVNLMARANERSQRNQIPLRPVDAFEAPAFYTYGPAIAQATLHDPNGTPIWVAGREYQITPGWSRIQHIVSEDEQSTTEQALVASGSVPERQVVDIGVTHWTVASEIGPIRISEADIREEVEMRASALHFPELAATAMAAAINVPIGAERQESTPLNDEDFALLQSVRFAINDQSGARSSASREGAPRVAPQWPMWKPFLDEFIEVFPPPVPECASVQCRTEVQALMQKIVQRFGPKYQRATDGVLPTVPPRTEEQAYQLWLAEQKAKEPVLTAPESFELVPA